MPYKIIFAVFASLVALGAAVAQTEPEASPQAEAEWVNPPPPPPSTIIRVVQEVLKAQSQGKLSLFSAASSTNSSEEYFSVVGISEAQKIFMGEKFNALGEMLSEEGRNLGETYRRWPEFSEEELTQFENTVGTFIGGAIDTFDSIFKETLTPPQLQLVREYNLAMPDIFSRVLQEISDESDDAPIAINFDAYEALDLSEEQRETLARLQEESEAEMQPVWDDVKTLLGDFIEETQKESPNEMAMLRFLGRFNQIKNKVTSLAKKTRENVEANLTPEQKERLAQIREEVPLRLAKIKEELEKKKAEPQDDSWKDAWKPGDPIPEHLKSPQPKRRFPFRL